jgi:hypothetical protein
MTRKLEYLLLLHGRDDDVIRICAPAADLGGS